MGNFGPVFMYDNVEELTYNFLNCMGLSVRPDGSVIDTELNASGGAVIKLADKALKANTNPNNIHYAGEGEIMLEILTNYKMLNSLLGLFLDKEKMFDDKEALSFFPEDAVDAEGNRISRLSVRFADNSQVSSDFYYNRCLAVIDIIFKLGEENVDIHNFDSIEVGNEKK
jgi:hypothetical protein